MFGFTANWPGVGLGDGVGVAKKPMLTPESALEPASYEKLCVDDAKL